MKYNVQVKTKAKAGDLIVFNYSGGNDPKPTLLYLTSIEAKNRHKLIAGFNLNYIKSYNKQKEIVFRARELAKRTTNAKTIYNKLIAQFPSLQKNYRIYSTSKITFARRFDFDQIKLVPAT